MKKIISLLALGAAALSSQAQDTKEVTRTYQNPTEQERYHVLRADPKVKHGPYERRLGRRNLLTEAGYYRQGARDSVWTFYQGDGKTPLIRGRFRQERLVGVWEAYDAQGQLVQQYDYTQRRLLLHQPTPADARITARPLAADAPYTTPPVFVGGAMTFFSSLGPHVQYPIEAIRRRIGGEVRIAFTVAPDGRTINYRVAQGIGAGCDEAALRAVQQVGGVWVPAQAGGQPVAAEVEVPLTFTIK